MKELSIEQKAKAYDDALKAAIIASKDEDRHLKATLERIFPELKESEDEKTERILHSISSKMSLHLRDIFTEEEFQCFDTWSNDWLEKQRVEMPADKVEPKFKVGDFIVNDYCFGKVIALTDDAYLLDTEQGIPFSCEHNAHLWTIQDAKPGDVLTNGDSPCIFKRCDGNGSLYVYCGINAHNDFSILSEDPENVWDDYSKQYFPATKEQRDTFFTKMKESGYEWLEETKELKKIEQKPTDKIEPKFKIKYAGSEYNVFETKDIAGATFYGIEDEPNHIDYVKADNCEIISVYAIKENGSPYPTKPAVFSEKKPKRMISAEAKEAMYDKPACAWSEKDENVLEDIKEAIINYWGGDTQDILLDWLKSLKDKYTWKPSDEQMKQLGWIAEQNKDNMIGKELISLYQDLRKLREG